MSDPWTYTTPAGSTLLDAAQAIERNGSRAVIVVGERNKVIGMISEGDILRALLKGTDVHAPIEEYVIHSFKYLTKKDPQEAFELIRRFGITLIPVVDDDLYLLDVFDFREVLEQAAWPEG